MLLLLIACLDPCPSGTTLQGEWYRGSVTAPTDAMSEYTTEGACVRPNGKREGRARGWYANGQLGMDAVFIDDVLKKSVYYDAWGHETDRFEGSRGTRTFWTEAGEKVLEGRWKRRSGPDGTWTGAGEWAGTATYERGEHTGGDAPWGPYLKGALNNHWAVRTGLPTASASPPSLTLAVSVDLTADALSIDGEQVVKLGPSGWREEDLKGSRIAQGYDRLHAKADTARALASRSPDFAFNGEWNLFAPASTRVETLLPLLATAKEAGFRRARVVVDTGILLPPRYGPPERRGGPAYGMVKLVGEPVGPTLQDWVDALE